MKDYQMNLLGVPKLIEIDVENDLYVVPALVGNGERFARVVREAWRQVAAVDREEIVEHWRKTPTEDKYRFGVATVRDIEDLAGRKLRLDKVQPRIRPTFALVAPGTADGYLGTLDAGDGVSVRGDGFRVLFSTDLDEAPEELAIYEMLTAFAAIAAIAARRKFFQRSGHSGLSQQSLDWAAERFSTHPKEAGLYDDRETLEQLN